MYLGTGSKRVRIGVTRLAGAEHTLKRQNWFNVTVFTAKKRKTEP